MPAAVTKQGINTRKRIVSAAATLMAQRGAGGTSLDDVRAATRSSKSQLYHYFGDKHGLVEAVIDHQAAAVLEAQQDVLDDVRTWRDLERWRDGMIAATDRRSARGGCPIGTLSAALADTDERFRTTLSEAFVHWRAMILRALVRLRSNGELASDADLEVHATSILAAIQGGLLLAKTSRETEPLRVALDGALAPLRADDVPVRRLPR